VFHGRARFKNPLLRASVLSDVSYVHFYLRWQESTTKPSLPQPNNVFPGNPPGPTYFEGWNSLVPQAPVDCFCAHSKIAGEFINREKIVHVLAPLDASKAVKKPV